MLDLDLNSPNPPNIGFKRIGVAKASTFTGFCIYHDTTIFREVDFSQTNRFDPTNTDMIVRLSLRAVAKELWLKRNVARHQQLIYNAISSGDVSAVKRIANTDDEGAKFLIEHRREYMGMFLTGTKTSLKRVERTFWSLYTQCENRQYHLSRSRTYEFPGARNIAASTLLSPQFDIHGNRIGSLMPGSDVLQVYLTIVPTPTTTWVVFLFHKRHEQRLAQFFSPFESMDSETLGKWFSLIALVHCENVAFSPSYVETMPPAEKDYAISVYKQTMMERQDYHSYELGRVNFMESNRAMQRTGYAGG
jgi:hypothetical protein